MARAKFLIAAFCFFRYISGRADKMPSYNGKEHHNGAYRKLPA